MFYLVGHKALLGLDFNQPYCAIPDCNGRCEKNPYRTLRGKCAINKYAPNSTKKMF